MAGSRDAANGGCSVDPAAVTTHGLAAMVQARRMLALLFKTT